MTDIAIVFDKLDLSSYVDVFKENGFDTWEDVLDITESDLEILGVKIGHRRRLQREIANSKGISIDQVIASSERASSLEPGQGGDSDNRQARADSAQTGGTGKRRYRRHPKPDKNAPERPPSAYVLFSNQVREELKPQGLTFTDIAKIVGERWQKLDHAGRDPYESQATSMKDDFNNKMSDYKKTESWRDYQGYLTQFKATQSQAAGSSGEKRVKLERTGESSHGSSRGSAGTPSTSAHGSPISLTSSNIQTPMPEAGSSSLSSPTSSASTGFAAYHQQMMVARSGGTPPSRQPGIGQPPLEHAGGYSQPTPVMSSVGGTRMINRRSNNPAPSFLQHRDANDVSTGSISSAPSTVSQGSGTFTPLTPVDTTGFSTVRIPDGDHTPTYPQHSLNRLSLGSPAAVVNMHGGHKPPYSAYGLQSIPAPVPLPLDSTSRILPPPGQPVGYSQTLPRPTLPPPSIPPVGRPQGQPQQNSSRMDGMQILALAGSILDGDGGKGTKPKPS